MPELREERTVGELFGQLTQDLTLLVRQEIQLAQTEISAKVSRIAANLAAIVLGGFVAYMAGLAFVAALILVLHDEAGLSPWVSTLIVGAVLALAGCLMLLGGLRELKRADLTPRRTVETLKHDLKWAKEQRP